MLCLRRLNTSNAVMLTLKCSIGRVVALNTCFPFYEVFHILESPLGIAGLPFVVKEMYPIYLLFTHGFLEVTDKHLWWKYSTKIRVAPTVSVVCWLTLFQCLSIWWHLYIHVFLSPASNLYSQPRSHGVIVSSCVTLLLAETGDALIRIFAANTDYRFFLSSWSAVNPLQTEGIFNDLH